MGPLCAKRENRDGADSGVTTRLEAQWIHARRMKDVSNEAFGDWVEGRGPWQWFVTRTLGTPVDMGCTKMGLGTARRCLRDLLIRSEAVRFVAVFEMQDERGVPHLHALLGGCRSIDGNVEGARDMSLWGIARWKAYKREAGAPAYLGKYLAKDVVELYMGDTGPYDNSDLKGPTLGGLRL